MLICYSAPLRTPTETGTLAFRSTHRIRSCRFYTRLQPGLSPGDCLREHIASVLGDDKLYLLPSLPRPPVHIKAGRSLSVWPGRWGKRKGVEKGGWFGGHEFPKDRGHELDPALLPKTRAERSILTPLPRVLGSRLV